MSKRTRKNKNLTNVSKVFNFLTPMAIRYDHRNDSLQDDDSSYGYGPVEVVNGQINMGNPYIVIPQVQNIPEGNRNISNLILECSFSFCQFATIQNKYGLFYPNCSAYLLTIIQRKGRDMEDLALHIFGDSNEAQTYVEVDPPQQPQTPARVFTRIGMGGAPQNNILDIQPLRTCNGNVQAPQYINQVYVPGPIQLAQGDYIVVLVVIPSAFTFVVPNGDLRVFIQGTCAARYDINF